MNNPPLQQMGERGPARAPRTSMQFFDAQKQKGPPVNARAPIRQQPNSPRAQLQQQQQHQQQALPRSLSVSPTQHGAVSHRSTSVSPIPHAGPFVGSQQPARRMSSPQQMYMAPTFEDEALPSSPRPMPTLQDGQRSSPTKRASFDPHLESVAPPFLQEKQRYLSPTKKKTIFANTTSFNIPTRPQMAVEQQKVASPRKSMIQQGQLLSPRKSTMLMPQPQLGSPRKSTMQQQDQPLSPRKSMLLRQGQAASSLNMHPEHSMALSEQENIPAAASYINHRSMSMSPAVQGAHFDEDTDDAYDDDNSCPKPVNRATSMSPVVSTVRFRENEGVILPSTSNNQMIKRSMSFLPEAQSTIKQQQVRLPAKMQPNMNAQMSLSPRQIQPQQQQPSSPTRMQSSINRSMSISPTQMNAEQQLQPRLSSGHLASVQGMGQKSSASLGVLQGGIFGRLGVHVC